MSEEVIDSSAEAGTGARPVFLTVLCILSFVAAGFGLLGYIGLITAMGMAEAALGGALGGASVVAASTGVIWAYIIVGFATTILGLVGVIKMWKLQKAGFMLYAVATAVSVIMSVITYGFGPSIVGIVISAGFVVMYQLNTKAMK
jgi:hypothetical protein